MIKIAIPSAFKVIEFDVRKAPKALPLLMKRIELQEKVREIDRELIRCSKGEQDGNTTLLHGQYYK